MPPNISGLWDVNNWGSKKSGIHKTKRLGCTSFSLLQDIIISVNFIYIRIILHTTRKWEKRKKKKNEDRKRLDTTPVELKIGMDILLQGVNSKLWNIQGVVKEIRAGGRSAYIYVPEKDKTYLRNRRYIKVNRSLEYIADEADNEENSYLALNVQQGKKVKKKQAHNQSQPSTKKRLSVTFSELCLMGSRQAPIPAKLQDSRDPSFHNSIKSCE